MTPTPLSLRACAVLCLCVPLVAGCEFLSATFAGGGGRDQPVDAAEATYRGAMEDFSDCATATDPAERAVLANRLATAAGVLQSETRPSNADHFYMSDRVAAAAAYCAAAVDGG